MNQITTAIVQLIGALQAADIDTRGLELSLPTTELRKLALIAAAEFVRNSAFLPAPGAGATLTPRDIRALEIAGVPIRENDCR